MHVLFYLGVNSAYSNYRGYLYGATSIDYIDCPVFSSSLYSCTYSTTDDEPCVSHGDDLYVTCIRGKVLHKESEVHVMKEIEGISKLELILRFLNVC